MLPVTTTEKYTVVLRGHERVENPPTFLFKCLNGWQQRDLLRLKEEMDKGNELEGFEGLFSAVESYLVGWENIDAEYGKVQLIDVITWDQCIWLMSSLVYQRPSVAIKKKSKSPSPSDGAERSAPTVQEATNVSESSPSTPAGDSTE